MLGDDGEYPVTLQGQGRLLEDSLQIRSMVPGSRSDEAVSQPAVADPRGICRRLDQNSGDILQARHLRQGLKDC
jgi:hypothetical protein